LNLICGPTRPSNLAGRFKMRSVSFLHSQSGNANKLAYGASVLHDGGADEFVDAVTVVVLLTVIVLADPLPVMVIVPADRVAVTVLTLVVVFVVVLVLVTVLFGHADGLMHPPGQFLPGASLHVPKSLLMLQSGSCWACTNRGTAANRAAIMRFIYTKGE
jgi:hypothetical protein